MTSRTSAIEHPVRRLLIALPEPYDTAREHYETSFLKSILPVSMNWSHGRRY